ncbi:MAG: membrane protein insertase YidC [Ignavibacteriales bacterium]
MDKQTTFAFILIGVILVIWLYLNSPQPDVNQPQKQDTTIVKSKEIDSLDKIKPAAKSVEQKPAIAKAEVSKIFPAGELPEKRITIENDLARIVFTSKGGRIAKYYLKEYNTWYYEKYDKNNFEKQHVQLIPQKDGGDPNLVFLTKEGELVNTAGLNFTTNLDKDFYSIKGKDELELIFTYTNPSGQQIKKSFKVSGNNYSSVFTAELINMGNEISGFRYDVEFASGINFVEKNSVDEANYSNASAYSGGEQFVYDASSPGNAEKKTISGKIDWLGIRNKYFAIIFSPRQTFDEGGARFEGKRIVSQNGGIKEKYNTSLIVPFNPSNYQKSEFDLYIGPMQYNLLKSYGKNYEAFYDFGSFFGLKFITRPISEYILLPLFQFLHLFIPNYGFVIIIFSIIIKLALHPLTRQSMKSMAKMQKLQPKINELKEKYKDDQQRIQRETMNLYSTYGINPAGGCLPMLLQMPILFALFTFFNVAIEIRHQPFIFWITNLSSPDYILSLPFKIPLFGIDKITGLAPLLGITMFFQQKMSVKDPSQKALVYVMPIMFTLMFMGFSSGLNLYYFMFNILSIGHQYLITHGKAAQEELVPVKNPKKKGGFMQRMMEAAEKQAQAQKEAQRKRK